MKFLLLLHLIPLFGIVSTKAASFSPPTDSIAPVIVCPASRTVQLAATRCDTVIQYTVSATDDQGQTIVIQLAGLASGSVFVPGTVVNQFLATDLSGNTATCSFSITVVEIDSVFVCKTGPVVIPLSPVNCSATITPLRLIEGPEIGCLDDYVVEIDRVIPFGNGPWTSAFLTATDAGKNYLARVRDTDSGVQCTVQVQIRDVTPPLISGADTIVIPCVVQLAHEITPDFLFDSLGIQAGKPVIADACSSLPVNYSYVDNVTKFSCLDNPGIRSLVRRKWHASDQFGNTSELTQIIVVVPVNEGFQLPAPQTTSCLAPDLSVDTHGRPFVEFFNRQYDVSYLCYWGFDYADTILQSGCSGNETVQRRWYLFNFCADMSPTNPLVLTQSIEINDTSSPVIQCPDDVFIEITDLDCHTAFGLPDVQISDACSGLNSIQAFWSDSSGLVRTLIGTLTNQTDSTATGSFATVPDFPVGSTEVLYVATDDCDNLGDCSFTVTLADPIPPTAVCDSFYHVQLPPDGYFKVTAASLDNGSADACAALSFKAKWLNPVVCDPAGSEFTDTLQLCCLNFGDTLAGVLRVYDIAVPEGTPPAGFGSGHFSECVFHVVLSGTAPPACTPPPNVTVNCSDFDPQLTAFGMPLALNCWVDSMHVSVDWTEFDSVCTNGTIIRRFQVFGENGQTGSCEQMITVQNMQHFYVRFPNDVFASACESTPDYGAPALFGVDCEKMEVTYSDEKITNLPDACYGILRTWTVTNTCRYDSMQAWIDVPNPNPGASPNDSLNLVGPVVSDVHTSGDAWQASLLKIASSDAQPTDFSSYFDANANGYRYIQIIQVTDMQAPELLTCPPTGHQTWLDSTTNDPLLWSSGVWYDPANNLPDLCEMSVPLSMAASDLCDGNDVKMAYKLFMDLNYDGIRETMVDSENPYSPGKVLYNNVSGTAQERQFDARPVPVNQKWQFAVQEIVVGDTKTAVVRFNTVQNPDVYLPAQLPYGNHRIRWYSTDGCGNVDSCEYSIQLKDGLPPVVVCLAPLSANMMSSGNIVFWASDFLQYTNDNCTHDFNLQIGIRKAGTGTGFPLDSTGMPEAKVKYNCDEIGVQTVELWSRDLAGNASFCQGQITINDPNHECGEGGPQVSGKIATELNQGVDSVVINISGFENFIGAFNFSPADYTDTSGYFQYLNLPITSDITVRPLLDNYPLNGLTTFDLVLISKHILSIEALGSPYKMIAADANRSNSITTFDIVELRKLLLGLYNELPNNNSWRFVPKSLVFPNPINPFMGPLPDSLHFQNVLTNLGNTDFLGIKIGDVNNSVVPHAVGPGDDRHSTLTYFDLHTEHAAELKPGDVFDLRLQGSEPLEGCQFTLNLDGLEVLELIPGEHMGQEHFAVFPEKNALTCVWENGGTPAFALQVRAREAGDLRHMVSIGSSITKAEAYPAGDGGAISLPVIRGVETEGFALHQNQPNPFSGSTEIRFNLPEASEATLEVTDMNGRVIYTQSGYYPQGINVLELGKDALEARGMLYYRLQTSEYSAQRKMLRL